MARGHRLPQPAGLTQKVALAIWSYNPETGELRQDDRLLQKTSGRLQVKFNGVRVAATRVIWLMMTGEWPMFSIDHENTNIQDARWKNLRRATHSQNQMNRRQQKRYSSSQYKGVKRRGNRWHAYAIANGVVHRAGAFNTEEEAARARDKVARRVHGEFARLNFPMGDENGAAG